MVTVLELEKAAARLRRELKAVAVSEIRLLCGLRFGAVLGEAAPEHREAYLREFLPALAEAAGRCDRREFLPDELGLLGRFVELVEAEADWQGSKELAALAGLVAPGPGVGVGDHLGAADGRVVRVNGLFVEYYPDLDLPPRGRLLTLRVVAMALPGGAEDDDVVVRNPVSDTDDRFLAQARDSVAAARLHLAQRYGWNGKKRYRFDFTVESAGARFTGDSLGVAFAVGAIAALGRIEALREEIGVNSAVAFCGALAAHGVLAPVDVDALKLKVYRGFWSDLKVLVIPRVHITEAWAYLKELEEAHRGRKLELMGADVLADVAGDPRLVPVRRLSVPGYVVRQVWKSKRSPWVQSSTYRQTLNAMRCPMRKLCLALLLMVLPFATHVRANFSVEVLNEDFSTDPFTRGWETNMPDRYYWSFTGQYLFTDNYTNSGEWATIPVIYNGESFRLTFRVKPARNPGDDGDAVVGILGPSRFTNSNTGVTEERVYVLFGGNNQIYIEGFDLGGQSFYSGAGSGLMSLDEWHDVVVTYDADTKQLALEVRRNTLPVLNWQTTLTDGFSSALDFFGASMVGSWITSDRHEYACIDDVVFSVEVPAVTVQLDVKPGQCPNTLRINVSDETDAVINAGDTPEASPLAEDIAFKGGLGGRLCVVPVALVGTPALDVLSVKRSSLLLNGVSPALIVRLDVATPLPDGSAPCDCHRRLWDGKKDLLMFFDKKKLVTSLGPVSEGEVRELTLTGQLEDGTPIEGFDCVEIHVLGGNSAKAAWIDDPTPNPFNPSTSFSLNFSEQANYTLRIVNVTGQTVRTYGGHSDGTQVHVKWDGTNEAGRPVASGTYFMNLVANGEQTDSKQMTLLK